MRAPLRSFRVGQPRLLICAAEPSGDQLAAAFSRAFRKRYPDVQIWGLTGPRMRDEGIFSVFDTDTLGAVGLVEAVPSIGRAFMAAQAFESAVRAWRPHAVLTVDSPSLMLRLARIAKSLETPAVHCVAPQVWAWRAERARTTALSVDRLLCLFPHEPSLFQRFGVDAHWIGHPAVASYGGLERSHSQGNASYGLAPGSRVSEVRRLWPVFTRVVAEIRRVEPDAEFHVARSAIVPEHEYRGLPGVKFVEFHELVGCSSVLCCSGTATLQLALAGTPLVGVYQLSPLSYAIARRLIQADQSILLPNILLGEHVVPEYVQDLDPVVLASALIDSRRRPEEAEVTARLLRKRLEQGDVVENAVDALRPWLGWGVDE